MKIKSGIVLREVADSFVLMDLGGELNFNGMITLNETGAFIFKRIEEGLSPENIALALADEYDISFETALSDVNAFIQKMNGVGVLE